MEHAEKKTEMNNRGNGNPLDGLISEQARDDWRLKARLQPRNYAPNDSMIAEDTEAHVRLSLQELTKETETVWYIQSEDDLRAFGVSLDDIEEKYISAIDSCSVYLDKKADPYFYQDKKRYHAVKNTKEMLEKELGYIPLIRTSLSSGKRNEYYQEKISFTKLVYVLRGLEDPVSKITIEDFSKILEDMECKAVLCRNGRLFKLDEKDSSLDNQNASTGENFRMAKHLITMLLERQCFSSALTRKKITLNMLFRLGADVEKQKAEPISLDQIREMIGETNSKLYAVDLILEDQEADLQRLKIAEQVDRLLGGVQFGRENRSGLKAQIRRILKTGEDSEEWRPTRLTGDNLDSLLNGSVEMVRDRAFYSALNIYQNRKKFNPAKDVELLSDEEMRILLGLAISEVTALNEAYAEVHALRIHDFENFMIGKGQNGQTASLKIENRLDADRENSKEFISECFAARNIIQTFSNKAKIIAKIFLKDQSPSELIKNPGERLSRELLGLYYALRTVQEHPGNIMDVTINGTVLKLTRDREGILILQSGHKQVALPYDARYWTEALEEDVCVNFIKYDKKIAKTLIVETAHREQIRNVRTQEEINRAKYEKFLTNYVHLTAEELGNLSTLELVGYTLVYCTDQWSVEKIQESVRARNQYLTETNHQTSIYFRDALESLTVMERMEKQGRQKRQFVQKRSKEIDFGGEDRKWVEIEKKILDFTGGIFACDQSRFDHCTFDTMRLREAILQNIDGFIELVNMSDRVRYALAQRFSFFDSFKQAFEFVSAMVESAKAVVQENEEQGLGLPGLLQPPKRTKSKKEIIQLVKNGKLDAILEDVAPSLQEAVNMISIEMQHQLAISVGDFENPAEDQDSLSVDEFIKKGMTGEEGEEAFNKKVMSGYIRHAHPADQQNMVAAAFRNAAYIGVESLQKLSEVDRQKNIGKFIAGYIKGAGPLLHKTLQGIPISNMPLAMQEAVKDVRSNLARINEDVVDSQLYQMIKESNAGIERVEKIQVLGAASVGQTILVRVYEKGSATGAEKVVKLLRPNVLDYMNREQKFMEECARSVDADVYYRNQHQKPSKDYVGGMEKTYHNKIEGIRRELDLCYEAENIEAGKIYEDELLHISSVKLDAGAKSMTNILIMEKAPGISVDKFLENKDKQRRKIAKRRMNRSKPEGDYQILNELYELREELKKKQGYLINVSYKWLDEAIFRSGFFHGDMHSGNIMIDDHVVTLIDYGNAHRFEQQEQDHIANLIFATYKMDAEGFTEHLKALIPEKSRELYEAKRTILYPTIRAILKKEDNGNPSQKIFVVLNEFQKEGIEIPSKFYSFVQSLVRIYGTLADYEELIRKVEEDMTGLMKHPQEGVIETNPDSPALSGIMKRILYLHDKKYKDYPKPENLQACIDEAVNRTQIDMEPLEDFCRNITDHRAVLPVLWDGMGDVKKLLRTVMDLLHSMDGTSRMAWLCYSIRYDHTLTESEFRNAVTEIAGWVAAFTPVIEKYHSGTNSRDTIDFLQSQYHELDNLTDFIQRKSKKPGYSQLQATHDLNRYMDIAKEIFIYGVEDSDEKQFVSDMMDLMIAVSPDRDETDWENVQRDYVNQNLSKEDTQRQRENEFKARKQLQKSAQKLYDRIHPKSYLEMLTDAILDRDTLIRMGNALQGWFSDDGGRQLQTAYETLVKEVEKGCRLTGDSPFVSAFTEAMIRCLTERAKRMESIIIHINAVDASADTDTVAWRLFQSRLFAVVFPS